MITLEQFKEQLALQNLTPEQNQQMLDLIQPFYDFSDYMMNKLNITNEEVEELAHTYTSSKLEEFKEHLNEIMKDEEKSVIHESILLTAKIYGDFARAYDYQYIIELETALATYLEISMIEHFKNVDISE